MGETTAELRAAVERQAAIDLEEKEIPSSAGSVSAAAVKSSVGAAAGRAGEGTKDLVVQSQQRAQELAGKARSTVSAAPAGVGQRAGANPLALGVVAFGAGLVAATLLRETDKEKSVVRRLQSNVESAAANIGQSAQTAIDDLRPRVEEAVAQVKEAAQQAVGTARQQLTDAASVTADEAKQAVNAVSHEAAGAVSTTVTDSKQAAIAVKSEAVGAVADTVDDATKPSADKGTSA